MALQAQAQLLDELMGKLRNVAPGEKAGGIRFDDDDVCKYHLCGFCPHDLFVNTKADLGVCNKIHDDELKRQYEKSSRLGKLGYEEEFERFLRSLLMDVERKIKRGNERLKLTQTDGSVNQLEVKKERVAYLKEEINTLIKQAESLGEEGKVEEAQQTLEACEKYKSECKYLENQIENNQHMEQKVMEVCEICGSFLIVNDAQARVEEHINGKQHMGYAKVKATLEEMRQKRLKEYEEREKLREKEREKRKEIERERDRDRDRRRDRSKDRRRNSRSRDRDRDRKRSKERKRSRSKERTKSHRSKSRSNSRNRKREHEKKRSRSREKRRHSRDDRRHRSKSRDKEDNHKNGHEKRARKSTSKTRDEGKLLKTISNSNGVTTNENTRQDDEIEQGEVV